MKSKTVLLIFLFSGLVWVISDIPTQYKIKKLIKHEDPATLVLSDEDTEYAEYRFKLRNPAQSYIFKNKIPVPS